MQSARANASDLQEADIKAMVTEAVLKAGGFDSIINNGDTVVIKPNLVIGAIQTGTLPPEVNGITTDYRVIKAIVELIRDINPDGTVYVMEGSANPTRPIMASQRYDHSHIPGVTEFLAIEEDSGAWIVQFFIHVLIKHPG